MKVIVIAKMIVNNVVLRFFLEIILFPPKILKLKNGLSDKIEANAVPFIMPPKNAHNI
jgi:hypothetical protein